MTDKEGYYSENFDFSSLKPVLNSTPVFRPPASETGKNTRMILIFSQHRFYKHLLIELAIAEVTSTGKPKNPLTFVDPTDLIWKTDRQEELKFYSGIAKFRNNYDAGKSHSDLEGLRALVHNPLKLDVYVHEEKISGNITAGSIVPVQLKVLKVDLSLTVDEREDSFEISARLRLEDKFFSLDVLKVKYHYFVELRNTLYLINNPYFLSVIAFFKQHKDIIVVHKSEFELFQENILSKLEEKVKIIYSFLKPATKKQIEEKGFDLDNEHIVYLSESEEFVLITPVIRYGGLEIPILSNKQIKAKDRRGNVFTLNRDDDIESQFIADISREHLFFYEQVKELEEQPHVDCFYLHRKRFMEDGWFLNAFEAWRNKGITVLGFNKLKDNKLNPYKANISIHVISGIDWFETSVKVKFDKQEVSLKHLHRSIRNKSKFVQLDDGTTGILPDEWIEKFSAYFNAGEVVENTIRTSKINYSSIEELYEQEQLDGVVKDEMMIIRSKLANFEAIKDVEVPDELNADLREYQKQGLNWLNFLDDFNFGACLADDMGLGKTIQVLAFILSQKKKVQHNTNLVVVPASLIFNWQQEVEKFAPTLKIRTLYGSERARVVHNFDDYDIVLTSYGTLLSDIRFLKEYRFNYIFLDESQTIKNPDSQRYKAVCLLKSRNKVVLTGTPIENNTFDLYGQLSFACPGLLGTKQHFKRLYSVPIDQFKDSRSALELKKKVNPFILRRTKEQVAKELPDKTEMVIYCEMDTVQRDIYEAAKEEIRDYLMGRSDDELAKSSMHVLQGITRLRQICDSPAILKEGKYENRSAKLDVLIDQIENKSPHHKILVFSQFVTMLDIVRRELINRGIGFEYLTGQTKDRSSVVSSFQTNPEIRVFLISLKAGGTGLNLTQADYVYLIDPWWNPAVENQAIDRSYRIGQQKNVVAVRLICPDTIEEKIMKMQSSKKDLATDLVKTEESIFKTLTRKDLLDLL